MTRTYIRKIFETNYSAEQSASPIDTYVSRVGVCHEW